MKKYNKSLSTFYFGGMYQNHNLHQLDGGMVRIVAKKRYTNETFFKDVTDNYARRILPDSCFSGSYYE